MFSIQVTGNNPLPSSFALGNGGHQEVTLGPSSFTVTESPVAGFTPTFALDCMQTSLTTVTGTISAGQTLFCQIENSQHPNLKTTSQTAILS